jgi:DNA (cytosine-5)-methyltransferase 1
MRAAHANGNGHGRSLDIEMRRLPTPTTRDTKGQNQRGDDTCLTGVRQPDRWGDYAESIARAEAVFGPAPEPTETDTCPCGSKVKSTPRLSCVFDQWLMGLPAGWITSVPGVTHAEALKMCGNGVVPAQAALAIRICLDRAMEAAA